MKNNTTSVRDFFEQFPKERQEALVKLRNSIKENLPKGFAEKMEGSKIDYVVPHSIYPNGYHCNPKDPLPFITISSEKNGVIVYHMGLYIDRDLCNWFTSEYPNYSKIKVNMGKSCVRFKKIDHIPYELMEKLSQKINPEEYIKIYETKLKR